MALNLSLKDSIATLLDVAVLPAVEMVGAIGFEPTTPCSRSRFARLNAFPSLGPSCKRLILLLLFSA